MFSRLWGTFGLMNSLLNCFWTRLSLFVANSRPKLYFFQDMHYNCHNAELDLSGNSYGWYGLDGQRKGYWAGSTGRILYLSCQGCAFFILLDMDSGADLDSDSKPNGCTETAPTAHTQTLSNLDRDLQLLLYQFWKYISAPAMGSESVASNVNKP